MRIKLRLTSKNYSEAIDLPLHYNKMVQGMIYSLIEKEIPNLHNLGYSSGKRKFRLFVFSRLIGRVLSVKNQTIYFNPPLEILVSSPLKYFASAMANNFMMEKTVRLGKHELSPESAVLLPNPDFDKDENKIKALSPITVYSTFKGPRGKSKTYFYHPLEPEFEELIKNNLTKKANALGIEVPKDAWFNIKDIKVKNKDQKIVYYGDTLIKGWLGLYKICAHPLLFELAYHTGLGSKNPQGFGMIELIDGN